MSQEFKWTPRDKICYSSAVICYWGRDGQIRLSACVEALMWPMFKLLYGAEATGRQLDLCRAIITISLHITLGVSHKISCTV